MLHFHKRLTASQVYCDFDLAVFNLNTLIFSLQLEDLCVVPKTSDSRLNTAKLVFQKKEENKENVYRYFTVILSIVFSFCGGYCLYFYADTLLSKMKSEEMSKSIEMKSEEMSKSIEMTALIVLVFYALSILGVVIFCLVREPLAQPYIGNAGCYFISCAILLLFVLFSLVTFYIRFNDETSPYYLYLFSFVVSFHFSWVSLGIFSNPLWAFPVLLTILTSIFLFYNAIYYYVKLRANMSSFVKLFLVMSITFFSYTSFTWISARSFFTNEIISSFIQTFLTACVGLVVHILVDKKTEPKKGTSEEKTVLTTNV